MFKKKSNSPVLYKKKKMPTNIKRKTKNENENL